MAENRQHEFNELTNTAEHYLTRSTSIPKAQGLDGWFQKLRLWHFPAFARYRSWTLFQRRGIENLPRTMPRQVTWDRPADANRLFDPLQGLAKGFHVDPTMEVCDRPVDTNLFQARLVDLQPIVLHPFGSSTIGIDGESFGIETDGFHNARLEWWCEGPEDWRELTRWAAEMRAWLDSVAAMEPSDE